MFDDPPGAGIFRRSTIEARMDGMDARRLRSER
jgi:hypothetical protein